MHTRGPRSVVLDLSAAGLHLDDDANVKLDYSLIFRETDVDRRSNRSECTGSSVSIEVYSHWWGLRAIDSVCEQPVGT